MTQHELFCMIFRVLDAEWDETHDTALGDYLSGANPYLFTDGGSAVPWVYEEFCRIIDRPVTPEDSRREALRYIASLKNPSVERAFRQAGEEAWLAAVNVAHDAPDTDEA